MPDLLRCVTAEPLYIISQSWLRVTFFRIVTCRRESRSSIDAGPGLPEYEPSPGKGGVGSSRLSSHGSGGGPWRSQHHHHETDVVDLKMQHGGPDHDAEQLPFSQHLVVVVAVLGEHGKRTGHRGHGGVGAWGNGAAVGACP